MKIKERRLNACISWILRQPSPKGEADRCDSLAGWTQLQTLDLEHWISDPRLQPPYLPERFAETSLSEDWRCLCAVLAASMELSQLGMKQFNSNGRKVADCRTMPTLIWDGKFKYFRIIDCESQFAILPQCHSNCKIAAISVHRSRPLSFAQSLVRYNLHHREAPAFKSETVSDREARRNSSH